MKIEIWSDVMCPFCYIGKRRFEQSLSLLEDKDQVAIEWKSYQLNPYLVTDPTLTIADYLSIHKGIPLAQAKQLNAQVTTMAAEEGLTYNFDKAVVANSFRAHVFTHFAKQYGKQGEAEELLFKSYFTDGKNIDDIDVLKSLVEELELDVAAFIEIVENKSLDDEVKMDIHEAHQIGVKGVPFFVYNRKYAISGAQRIETFEQTLQKALSEYQELNSLKIQDSGEGSSCSVDGCD